MKQALLLVIRGMKACCLGYRDSQVTGLENLKLMGEGDTTNHCR